MTPNAITIKTKFKQGKASVEGANNSPPKPQSKKTKNT
jgi:hypothetical protein